MIEKLGYEPNAAARALSTGRTSTLGVLAPFFTQPSVVERLRGVSRVVSGAGYQIVLFDVERRAPFGELTAGGRLDGLLCVSLRPTDAEIERFEAAGVPVALIDCEHPRLSGVSIDDVAGGRLAAGHLLEQGHRPDRLHRRRGGERRSGSPHPPAAGSAPSRCCATPASS